ERFMIRSRSSLANEKPARPSSEFDCAARWLRLPSHEVTARRGTRSRAPRVYRTHLPHTCTTWGDSMQSRVLCTLPVLALALLLTPALWGVSRGYKSVSTPPLHPRSGQQQKEQLFLDPINVNPPHISTDKAVKYDYDIVYVRTPRKGDRARSLWTEI